MPFVMTRAGDTADVEIEIDGEILTLTVGAIPNEIGEKITELGISNFDAIKANEIGDEAKVLEIMSKNIAEVNKMVMLLCKYGIRGHKGLEYSDGSPVPCNTEEEKDTGYTILTEETLNLYLGNSQILNLASAAVTSLRQLGIGKYVKGGFKTIKEAEGEIAKAPKKRKTKSVLNKSSAQ